MDDEDGDETEGSKKVAQEQGSSGTFNNSRRDDGYDPDIADTTIITYHSGETTMQEKGASSTKQVLAELIAADNNGSQPQQLLLEGQNGASSQAQVPAASQRAEAVPPSEPEDPAPTDESQAERSASTQNQQGKRS